MKKNTLAFIVLLLLCIVAFYFIKNNSKSTIKKELRDFAVKDTSLVDKIFIADKTNKSVTLTKSKNGKWLVNGKYQARKDAIKVILATIADIRILSPIPKTTQDMVIKNLASSAIKVEIYENEKRSKVYYVGGEAKEENGTYMLLSNPETGVNSSVPFSVYLPGHNGYLTTRFFVNETDWRERTVFEYNPITIKSLSIEFPLNSSQSYSIINDGNNHFTMQELKTKKNIENFDTVAVKQYLAYYENIQYESIEEYTKKDSITSSTPAYIITVVADDGTKNKVKLFLKPAPDGKLDIKGTPLKHDLDRMFALINDEKDFVTVQYFVFGKLLQEYSYFVKK